MLVCIITFWYLCILFYPVHQNENEIIKNISMIYSIGKLTQAVNLMQVYSFKWLQIYILCWIATYIV